MGGFEGVQKGCNVEYENVEKATMFIVPIELKREIQIEGGKRGRVREGESYERRELKRAEGGVLQNWQV